MLFEEGLSGIRNLIFGEKYFFSSPGVVRVESGGDLGIEHQALHQLFVACIEIAVN